MIILLSKLEEADMWYKAYISMGSNLGDREQHLRDAVAFLNQSEHIKDLVCSGFYTTSPVGYLDQGDFVNAVVALLTDLSPVELLAVCQAAEQAQHRERIIRWGPRTLDLDILLYEGYTSESELLTVPHPRMLERAFVMVPLSELAPNLVVNGKTVFDWCQHLTSQEVRKMDHEKW